MTRSQWATHATVCPWQAPGRRCHWADSTAFMQPRIKCRERNCANLDPERSPYAGLYRMLATHRRAALKQAGKRIGGEAWIALKTSRR